MRRALLLLLVWGLALSASAELRVLVIDQSQTLEESMRLLAFVRALKPYGIAFQALTALPHEPWTGEPVVFVVHIPSRSKYIWFCPPGPEHLLPELLKKFAQEFKAALAQAFRDVREVRGPADDLYPLLLSLYFRKLGLFGGP